MQSELDYYISETIFRPSEKIHISKANVTIPTGFHAHEFIEIAYVASGSGKHIVGENEYSAIKGSVFLINHNVPHSFVPHSTDRMGMIIYNCIFLPEFLDLSLINCKDFLDVINLYLFKSFFHASEEPIPFIELLDCESLEIEELYYKMYSEYENAKRGYTAILRAHVIELLVKLLRIIYTENAEEKLLNNGKKQIIDKVLNFISTNYAKNIRLEELSMMAFLSTSHFSRQFKEHTGVTISEYTQKVRIDEACKLLRKTDSKIVDIALQVGYNDIKYFNEVFKRYTGYTPGQYRKEK